MQARAVRPEDYLTTDEPHYVPNCWSMPDEIQVFEAAYLQQLAVLLKGLTGCGKTRICVKSLYYIYV